MHLQLTANSLDNKQLAALTSGDYDQLAFGVIELDRDFIVRTYNQSESTIARRDPATTVGKHFFREVAPCTDVDDFRGRIQTLMAAGVAIDTEARFDYTFRFAWGSRRVRIRALRGTETCWLFVTPLRSFDAG